MPSQLDTLFVPSQDTSEFPVTKFLAQCHEEFIADFDGATADYIPELTKADPSHFGIALATLDGHVHEVGDTRIEFTVQSISKALVFGLALEFVGHELVSETIGVEASGEAFNSIRLQSDNRPFNPMVNAGAIACTGLIYQKDPDGAFERIRQMLSDFAGRELSVDESVYNSESETGDRNRAIAWLLRNNNVLHGSVDGILDTYFRQCAILVSARDLAVMGATLASNGVNPITKKRVISPSTTVKTLSIMVNAGMYDFSGNWTYRVGLPAKSGVAGGIVAILPSQVGLGTFSPLLDDLGNSVRGIKFCERISSHFGLHVLASAGDVASNISADYTAENIYSSRGRSAKELKILSRFSRNIRVIELSGELDFVACDYICRKILSGPDREYIIFDVARVTSFSPAALIILAKLFAELAEKGTRLIVSNLGRDSNRNVQFSGSIANEPGVTIVSFNSFDEALAWAEDQLVFQNGGFDDLSLVVDFSEQALMQGLGETQISTILGKTNLHNYTAGEDIIRAGDKGDSVYFLLSGMVSVKLANNVNVASLSAGTCFGEFALVVPDSPRSAYVVADVSCSCLCLTTSAYAELGKIHPELTEKIMQNLALLLTNRLHQSNAKIEKLSKS